MTNRGRIMCMSTWKSLALAGAAVIVPVHAGAAPTPTQVEAAEAPDGAMNDAALAEAKAKMQKEIDEAIALVEKIFEVDKLPPVDPARLALARQTTAALIPAGSLEKMLDNMYGKIFKAVMEQAGGMSDLMLSIKTGVDDETLAGLDADTKSKAVEILDPNRKAREEQVMEVVKPLISEVLRDLEAPMRDGMAHAYSRKFTAAHLGDMNSFFATPAGSAFAGEWMALQADPEVMIAMIKAVPPLIEKFIDRAPELEGKFKALPKERGLADLSETELSSLAKLMKVDVATLKEHRDMWMGSGEANDAGESGGEADWESASDADSYDVADPALDRSNWTAADRERVETLEAAADEASGTAFDAEMEAVANARKRLKIADPSY